MSVINAFIFIDPPQAGHTSGSISKTPFMHLAQLAEGRVTGSDKAAALLLPAQASVMHTTHLVGRGDESGLRKLKLDLTTDGLPTTSGFYY